jgi:hypothetical protein
MKLFLLAVVGASLAHARANAEPPLVFERRDLSAGEFGQVTQGMGAGDVDGDGRIDLVVVSKTEGRVKALVNATGDAQ